MAVSLSLLVASAAAEQAPTATAEENFAAGFINGRLESRRRIGLSERHSRAQCVCTVSDFRASLSEDEFRVLVTLNTLSDDLLIRLSRSALECETVGTYDTVTKLSASQLLPARRFERFSIQLPQGFIPNIGRDSDGKPAYMFFRLHADLETSATINVGLIPIVDTRFKGKGARSSAIAQHVVSTMRFLKQNGATLVHSIVPDIKIGSLTLQGIEYRVSKDGADANGFAYVTVADDEAVILLIKDVTRNASETLPLMRESLKTLVFHEGRAQ